MYEAAEALERIATAEIERTSKSERAIQLANMNVRSSAVYIEMP